MERINKTFELVMLICILAITIISFVVAGISGTRESEIQTFASSQNYVSFSTKWVNEHGIPYDISSLYDRDSELSVDTPLVLTRVIPESEYDNGLFFHVKNLVVNVYINDRLVSEMGSNGRVKGFVTFNNYVYVDVPKEAVGKNIKLEIYKTDMPFGSCIDNVYFGSGASITSAVLLGSGAQLVIGALSVAAGLVFVLIGVVTRKTVDKNRSYIFYGLFILFMGVCFALDTVWAHLLLKNTYFIAVASRAFLMAAIPSFVMYIATNYDIYHQKLLYVLSVAASALLPVALILNLTGIFPMSAMTPVIHIFIIVGSLPMLIELIYYIVRTASGKVEYSRVYYIALILFMITVLYDILRYYQSSNGDSFIATRVGIIVFTIASFGSALEDIMHMIRLGLKAGKIGKIAFTDANTGIGNLAAFKSKFDELEIKKKNYSYIGIIQFDVNNLKIINDSKGHEAGDLLIKTAADIINASFGKIGTCYRTGGDEFVAITTYNHAPLVCEDAIYRFENMIERFNEDPDKPFDLRIAYGVAYFKGDDDTNLSLKEVHRLADERMYNKKRELKARYARNAAEAEIR
ncbi:MAG: diguanylate cyclase domain-containing protein [Ruminiclostridium sp.]